MDHPPLNPFLFVALIMLFAYSSISSASIPVVLETGIYFATDGTMYYKPVGTASSILMYPDLKTSKDVSVNTSKGAQSLTVERTPKIDLGRVGASVIGFAKLLGPIGVGISVAQLICTQAKLCNSDGVWQKQADAAVAGYPLSLPGISYHNISGWQMADGSRRFPTADLACTNAMSWYPYTAGSPWVSATMTTATNCRLSNATGGTLNLTTVRVDNSGCPNNYSNIGGQCTLIGNSVPAPAQISDWDAAKALLNTSNFIQPLLDKGEAVPISLPPKVPMIEKIIGTTTEPTYDAQGNLSGSKVTTTKLQATDVSTAAAPNTFNISESTTINNYNTSNVLTSTTTTVVNPPEATVPAADPTTFDAVNDLAITTKQVDPGAMNTTSWGEGECPAGVSIATSFFGSHVIPMTRACEFAVGVKPVIILIASLAALFIVAGVRTSED